MSSSSPPADRSTIGASDEISEYRSLSGMAVASLVLGLCSLAALATPVLLVLPVLAIGAGLIALKAIERSGGNLTGDGIARVGIFLGAALLTATLVRDPVRNRLMARQADEGVRNWLSLLADGKLIEAQQRLTPQAIGAMLPEREPGAPPPSDEEINRHVQTHLADDPLRKLLAEGDRLAVEPVGDFLPADFNGAVTTLVRRYRITAGQGPAKYGQFTLRRVVGVDPSLDAWQVQGWQLADGPFAAPEPE